MTVVRKILNIMDKSEDLIEFVEDRPGHDFRYSLNSKKISDELGWKRNTNFDEGIRKTPKRKDRENLIKKPYLGDNPRIGRRPCCLRARQLRDLSWGMGYEWPEKINCD